jgi:CBS-domain-containing membrane protein
MNISETLKQMQETLNIAFTESEKFLTKGNASAGTRLRKCMQDIKAMAQDVRTNVSEIKNEGKK